MQKLYSTKTDQHPKGIEYLKKENRYLKGQLTKAKKKIDQLEAQIEALRDDLREDCQ